MIVIGELSEGLINDVRFYCLLALALTKKSAITFYATSGSTTNRAPCGQAHIVFNTFVTFSCIFKNRCVVSLLMSCSMLYIKKNCPPVFVLEQMISCWLRLNLCLNLCIICWSDKGLSSLR